MTNVILTQDELKRHLNYNPDTGIFTWLITGQNRVIIGSIAGCFNHEGYWRISVNSKRYQAHRLAWLYMTGSMPANEIDHINGNRSDNRISNLREADRFGNTRNVGLRITNSSGLTGVSWNKRSNNWRAYARKDKKHVHLGYFDTKELAHEAYKKYAKEEHGIFYLE